MYPGCKIIKSELRGDLKSSLIYVNDISILSESLTPEQKAIFRQWKINGNKIKLPILTLDEVRKLYPPPVKKN